MCQGLRANALMQSTSASGAVPPRNAGNSEQPGDDDPTALDNLSRCALFQGTPGDTSEQDTYPSCPGARLDYGHDGALHFTEAHVRSQQSF